MGNMLCKNSLPPKNYYASVYRNILPLETIMNDVMYCNVLRNLQAAKKNKIKKKNALNFDLTKLLLHDNDWPHSAPKTKEELEKFKWEIFPHSPYFPDLAPSDFHLFPTLKLHLGGKHFHTEIKSESNNEQLSMTT